MVAVFAGERTSRGDGFGSEQESPACRSLGRRVGRRRFHGQLSSSRPAHWMGGGTTGPTACNDSFTRKSLFMTTSRHPLPPLFSQLDVSTGAHPQPVHSSREEHTE